MKTYDMQPIRLTCPHCGKVHTRNAAWRYGDYCSVLCYRAMPFPRHPNITNKDFDRACRQYPNQKAVAQAIGVSYVQVRRVIAKRHLRDKFPARGGAATWA